MAEKPKTSAASAENPFPMPDQSHPALGSILNLLAVAMAEGSGDPQVKNRVLQDLAGQRHARETAVARRREFEADLILIDQRSKVDQEAEIAREDRAAATPEGRASAQLATETISPDAIAARAKGRDLDLQGRELAVEGAKLGVDLQKKMDPLELETARLTRKLTELKVQEQETQTKLAADPENQALQQKLRELQVQLTEAQILETKAQAAERTAKAAGNGKMSRAEATRFVLSDPLSVTLSPEEKARRADSIRVSSIMPSWLAYIPETEVIPGEDLDGRPNRPTPVTTIKPGSPGKPGAMPAARKAEIAVILEDIGGKIGSNGMYVSVNEQTAYAKALEDILTVDPASVDNILIELAEQMFQAAGYEENSPENRALTMRALYDLLRNYNITPGVLNKIALSAPPTQGVSNADSTGVARPDSTSAAR